MRSRLVARLALLALVALTGCSRKLMPTPCVFWSGEVDPFVYLDEDDRSPELSIFYATDRPAAGDSDDRKYRNGRGLAVRLGEVSVRLGGHGTDWDDLYAASMARERSRELPLLLLRAREHGALMGTADEKAAAREPLLTDPTGQQAWAAAIDRRLAASRRKVINIYVHGANVAFYDSVVVAAQFCHFQGRDGVMLAYSWPTRQSPVFYGFDRREAIRSVPNLTELLDFLASNTRVESINLLGYSAGGPLVAGALADLRERYPELQEPELQRTLRITNVVFAASDSGLREFVEQDLKTFHPLPESIRVTISADDGILHMAGALGGGGRLGSGNAEAELTREELDELDELLPKIDVIDVSYHDTGRDGGSFKGHGYWYGNAWVSTDVLASFRWNVPAEERGLARAENGVTWYFPNDYPERIVDLVLRIDRGEYDPSSRGDPP